MARDYKGRANRGRKQKKPVSAWVWLLIGFVLGGVSVGFVCLKYAPHGGQDNWIGDRPPAVKESAPRKVSPEPARVSKPKFDFYNLLPDQEVLIPDEEVERQVSKAPPSPPPARTPEKKAEPAPSKPKAAGKRYMVQVSSFRSRKEAESLKARLALLGLRAHVNSARIKGGTWYRVQLGPYANAAAMQDVRRQLASSGYKSLAIALK
ncbi:SPOR domain-containing protein [Thiolapillus sp.]